MDSYGHIALGQIALWIQPLSFGSKARKDRDVAATVEGG